MIPSITTDTNQQTVSTKSRFGGLQAVKPQFGAAGKPSLLQRGDRFLDWAGANRTREMLVEDFGGFGVLRTMMDSLRGFFYGTGGFNIPAASERLTREGFSIFTDNILAGISAAGFGKVADQRLGTYSNKWTDFPTLELFQQIVQRNVAGSTSKKAAELAFLKGLSEQLTLTQPNQQKACLEMLQNYWDNPTQDKAALAAQLSNRLGIRSFDLRIRQNTFKIDNLLDDVRLFKEQMERLPVQNSWQETAQKTLTNTLRVKNWKLGFVGLGMAATFAVPYVINQATKKFFGINYYTGEIGLEDKANQGKTNSKNNASPVQTVPAFNATPNAPRFAQSAVFNQFMATPPASKKDKEKLYYVKESWQNGNKWPMLLALLPVPIAAGMFDTVNWKFLKPFSKAWRNSLDFSKSAPFTTQQQMAATFALLIISRLMASRSDNEFRERIVDSGLGWILWILGTPLIKRAVAGYLDHKAEQGLLLKEVPIGPGQTRKMLRTSAEINQLGEYMHKVTPEMIAKAQKQLKLISRGSLLASLGLLGIVEPFVAIQWTKYNSRKKAEQTAQTMSNQSLPSMNSPVFSQTAIPGLK